MADDRGDRREHRQVDYVDGELAQLTTKSIRRPAEQVFAAAPVGGTSKEGDGAR